MYVDASPPCMSGMHANGHENDGNSTYVAKPSSQSVTGVRADAVWRLHTAVATTSRVAATARIVVRLSVSGGAC